MGLPSSATSELAKDSQRIVFLAHIFADEPGKADLTTYLATEELTIVEFVGGTSHDYDAGLVSVDLGWVETNPRGGLANRGDLRLSIDDGTRPKLGALSAGYQLQGDLVQVYSMYHDEGATTLTWHDFICHGEYRIQSVQGGDGRPLVLIAQQELWNKELMVPTRVVRPAEFPNAPEESYGIPFPYGTTYYDRAARYVPAVCIDKYLHKYIGAINIDAGGPGDDTAVQTNVFQYYRNGNKFANIPAADGTKTITDHVLEIEVVGVERVLDLVPARATANSDIALDQWAGGAPGRPSMGSGDVFEIAFEGVPKYGTISDVDVIVDFEDGTTRNYDIDIKYFGTSVYTLSSWGQLNVTANNIDAHAAIDWSSHWDFEGVTVEITANNTTTPVPYSIVLQVTYDDQTHLDGKVFEVATTHIKIDESADLLNPDGASNPAIGNIVGAPELLQYILRANFFLDYNYDEIDSTLTYNGVSGADDSEIPVALPFFRAPISPRKLLDDLAFLGRLHLIRGEGTTPFDPPTWRVRRRSLILVGERHSLRYGSGDMLLRSIDAKGRPTGGNWITDATFTRLKTSDVLNEFAIAFGPNGYQEDDYSATIVETGRTTLEGTCSTTTPAKKLIADSGTPFTADMVGQKVWVDGAADVNVVAAFDSTSQLELTDDPGANSAGTDYYLGPNLNYRCLQSRLRHGNKTNALGGTVSALKREGVYKTDILSAETPFSDYDDLMAYLTAFLSESWLRFECVVDWGAGCTWRERLGENVHIYHPALPDFAAGELIGTVDTVDDASPPGSFTLGSGEVAAAGVEVGDILRVEMSDGTHAMCDVISISTDTIGWGGPTTAYYVSINEIDVGDSVYLIKKKWAYWELVGYKPNWAGRNFHLRFQQVPGDFY